LTQQHEVWNAENVTALFLGYREYPELKNEFFEQMKFRPSTSVKPK